MRRSFSAILTGVAVLLQNVSSAQPADQPVGTAETTILAIEPNIKEDGLLLLNLNRVFSGDTITFQLILEGGAENELLQSLSTSCGCTQVEFQPTLLAPGEKIVYKGSFHAPNVPSPRFYPQSISIETDSRTIRIGVIANVLPISQELARTVTFKTDAVASILTEKRTLPEGFQYKETLGLDMLDELGLSVRKIEAKDNASCISVTFDPMRLRKTAERKKLIYPLRKNIYVNTLLIDKTKEPWRIVGAPIPIQIVDDGDLKLSPSRVDFGSAQTRAIKSVNIESHASNLSLALLEVPPEVSANIRSISDRESIVDIIYLPGEKKDRELKFIEKSIILKTGGLLYSIPFSLVEQ